MRLLACLPTCLLTCCLIAPAAFAEEETRWYKGVTHIHSIWSDGDMAPEMIADWYKERDYHFVCFSEHNRMQSGEYAFSIEEDGFLTEERVDMIRERFGDDWVVIQERAGRRQMVLKTHDELGDYFNEDEKFLMIPAEEITTAFGSPHVNAVNLRDNIPGTQGNVVPLLNQYLDAVHEQSKEYGVPMIAHVNHLNWSDGVSTEQMLQARRLKHFEIYNGHPGVRQWGDIDRGMPSNDRHWDVILSLRMRDEPDFILYGLATDDSHRYFEWGLGRVNPGRGWVMVRATALDEDIITGAMDRGDFYSSTGVTLHDVVIDDEGYRVIIDAEEGVSYTTEFIGTRVGFDDSSEAPEVEPDGGTPRPSRRYHTTIGQVLHTTTDTNAYYPFDGDEIYVRARVTSDKLQDNPVHEGDFEMVWTQPVRVATP